VFGVRVGLGDEEGNGKVIGLALAAKEVSKVEGAVMSLLLPLIIMPPDLTAASLHTCGNPSRIWSHY
jgi:hypothetical protein